jgi:hypothetical protein
MRKVLLAATVLGSLFALTSPAVQAEPRGDRAMEHSGRGERAMSQVDYGRHQHHWHHRAWHHGRWHYWD